MEEGSVLLSIAISLAMLGTLSWLWTGLLRDEKEELAAGEADCPRARLIRIQIRQGDAGMWFATSAEPDVFVSGTTLENVREIVPEAIARNIEERDVVILATDHADYWIVAPRRAVSG